MGPISVIDVFVSKIFSVNVPGLETLPSRLYILRCRFYMMKSSGRVKEQEGRKEGRARRFDESVERSKQID
jgi:hypothetical protein